MTYYFAGFRDLRDPVVLLLGIWELQWLVSVLLREKVIHSHLQCRQAASPQEFSAEFHLWSKGIT